VSVGVDVALQQTSAALLSGNGGYTNLGYARQQAIKDVFAAAAGRQYTLGHDYATAFQVRVVGDRVRLQPQYQQSQPRYRERRVPRQADRWHEPFGIDS
jgi:hypothetical protein